MFDITNFDANKVKYIKKLWIASSTLVAKTLTNKTTGILKHIFIKPL
jgi:hypothetical protein